MDASFNALGPSDRASTCIGRAVRLVLGNLLEVRPGGIDRATLTVRLDGIVRVDALAANGADSVNLSNSMVAALRAPEAIEQIKVAE